MKKGTGCNTCTHPTCTYSLNSNGVINCAECEYGVLVLDPSSGPKWKLGCNRYLFCVLIFNTFGLKGGRYALDVLTVLKD